jgi:hypothetical protein
MIDFSNTADALEMLDRLRDSHVGCLSGMSRESIHDFLRDLAEARAVVFAAFRWDTRNHPHYRTIEERFPESQFEPLIRRAVALWKEPLTEDLLRSR